MKENKKVLRLGEEEIKMIADDFDLLCDGMKKIFKAILPSELYEEANIEQKTLDLLNLSKDNKTLHMLYFLSDLQNNDETIELFNYILSGEVQKCIDEKTAKHFVS